MFTIAPLFIFFSFSGDITDVHVHKLVTEHMKQILGETALASALSEIPTRISKEKAEL